MNILFSIYTQFKSKVGKLGLGLCACGARMLGDAWHRATKRVLQDTDLKNPGWPRPKTSSKPNKDQISRSKPKAKDQDQSQNQRPKSKNKDKDQGQILKTSQVLGLG